MNKKLILNANFQHHYQFTLKNQLLRNCSFNEVYFWVVIDYVS